ncbi:MAG TPA: exo-alpha-sialidase [Candidatus Dormibacteraeota bacterium]|nr:exo-alpha-sialidase [Candidatus Dormibacteraeota bacterium]
MILIRKFLSAAAVASCLAILIASSGAAKTTVVSPVQVSSSASPYDATCDSSDSNLTGHVFVNSTVEPQLAVGPSGNMIAMWHQDRWNNGGAHGIGVASSSDGRSWNDTTIPWDFCSDPKQQYPALDIYFRNSDPWVSFGPDGTAYASALAFNLQAPNNDNSVAVATLPPGGTSWQNIQPVPGSVFTTFSQSTDKNSTTADPTIAGTAYTVWDTLIEPTDNPDDNPHTCAYTGPAFFSMTKDGGATWSPATVMVNTANRQQTIGNVIVVAPATATTPRTLYDFFDNITTPNTCIQGTRSSQSVAFVTSTNDGATWSQPQVIAPFNSLGVIDPNTGEHLRVGDGLQEVARDSVTGDLYVVWESSSNYAKNVKQGSAAFDNEILLTMSTDGGKTWSPTPTSIDSGNPNNSAPAFTPTVAAFNHRVAITYYDSRNLQSGQMDVMPTDYWARVSGNDGLTFGPEQRLTPVSFDMRSAPVARGFFVGDYEGLQPNGAGFEAVFVKTNCNAISSTNFTTFTGSCGPANSNISNPQTSNMNPTDVFAMAIS